MDLRILGSDLVGKKFIKKGNGYEQGHILNLNRKFVIDEVYANYVKAHTICENGYKIVECFSIGDLVQLGVLSKRRTEDDV